MDVMYQCCAGLDVHQRTVVACVRRVEEHGVVQKVETFKTTTKGLASLKTWLLEQGCTHAAMESTGVYWKPVWMALEGDLTLILANAQEVRSLPGRKSDVNDAMWLADLLAHGLIRGSFVPPGTVQALRELSRTRTQLKQEVTRHTQRIQKTLESSGLKLTGLISDVLGVTGRAILAALIAGEKDPKVLAQLKRKGIRATEEQLRDALQGRLLEHHRLLLRLHLEQVDTLELAITELESRMGDLLDPFRSHVELIKTVPGIQEKTARIVLAEIGFETQSFPTAGHLLSWAGLCPGSDESAGKRRSARLRKGNPWLRTALVQAAWAATRKKDSYLRALFQRLRARRGAKKAIVAVAASMLSSIYFMLQRQQPYTDPGPDHFDTRQRDRVARRLIRRLEELGFHVEAKSAAA
jgi:transposase